MRRHSKKLVQADYNSFLNKLLENLRKQEDTKQESLRISYPEDQKTQVLKQQLFSSAQITSYFEDVFRAIDYDVDPKQDPTLPDDRIYSPEQKKDLILLVESHAERIKKIASKYSLLLMSAEKIVNKVTDETVIVLNKRKGYVTAWWVQGDAVNHRFLPLDPEDLKNLPLFPTDEKSIFKVSRESAPELVEKIVLLCGCPPTLPIFNFDLIGIFNEIFIKMCDKYQINVSYREMMESKEAKESLEEVTENVHKKRVSILPIEHRELPDLKKLESYPMHSIFQEGNKYLSRVSEFCLFEKIMDDQLNFSSFKAYYRDFQERNDANQKVVIEAKSNGVYIKYWQAVWPLKNVPDDMIQERSLTSYEVEDFQLGIEGLQKMQKEVSKILGMQEKKEISQISEKRPQSFNFPLVLIHLIFNYMVYDIPLELIGRVDVDKIDISHLDLARKPGLELFDRMKAGEIYRKYGYIFYFCGNLKLIHRWTKEGLQQESSTDYHYSDPISWVDGYRVAGDPIVCEKVGWSSTIFADLRFFTKAIESAPKKGQVLHYNREIVPGVIVQPITLTMS